MLRSRAKFSDTKNPPKKIFREDCKIFARASYIEGVGLAHFVRSRTFTRKNIETGNLKKEEDRGPTPWGRPRCVRCPLTSL